MNITEHLTTPHLRTAYMLLNGHLQWTDLHNDKPNGKATAIKKGEFRGMCKAIDRLDLAPTDFAVEMAVVDSVWKAPNQPTHSFAGGNQEHTQWVLDRCNDIVGALGWEQH